MAEIVNLRSIRKRKAREQDARQADENRFIHGRSKSQKLLEKTQAEHAAFHLEAHLRQRGFVSRLKADSAAPADDDA